MRGWAFKAGLMVEAAEFTEEEMAKMGFHRFRGDDYYDPRSLVVVQDLHDENAVISPKGSLIIFDPIPVMARAVDFERGGMLHGEPRRRTQ